MAPTTFTILRVLGRLQKREADLPAEPGYDRLKALICPLLNDKHFEHVSVIHNGKPADMFVDETGAMDGQVRNEAATKIYRTNWLKQHPKCDPETLPAIYGTAIVFDRRVWF